MSHDLGNDVAGRRAPPVGAFSLCLLPAGGCPRQGLKVAGVGFLRVISGLALPAAVAITWLHQRGQRGRSAESVAEEPRSHPRPQRRELIGLIRGGASLAGFDLSGAHLTKRNLRHRDFSGADLSRARLAGSKMTQANLTGAVLDFADLSGCDLRRASLSGASLVETSFWGADLRGADLSNCRNIIMANVRRARFDRSTRWPGRLDPRTLGAVLVEDRRKRP